MLFKLGDDITQEGDLSFCSIAHIDNLPEYDIISYAEMTNHEGPEITTPLAIKALFDGQERFQINRKDIKLTKNEFLIINSGQHYKSKIQSSEFTHTFSLSISPKSIYEVMNSILSPFKEPEDTCSKSEFPNLFLNEVHKGDYDFLRSLKDIRDIVTNNELDNFLLKERIYEVVVKLFSKHEKIRTDIQKVPAIKNSTRKEIYKRIQLTKEYVEEEFAKGLTLDDLSKVSAISPFYLIKLFKHVHGITPYQYIMKLRLKQACKLLMNTQLNISEICTQLNIKSQQSFSNLFNREFNCSPLAYRKKARVNNHDIL